MKHGREKIVNTMCMTGPNIGRRKTIHFNLDTSSKNQQKVKNDVSLASLDDIEAKQIWASRRAYWNINARMAHRAMHRNRSVCCLHQKMVLTQNEERAAQGSTSTPVSERSAANPLDSSFLDKGSTNLVPRRHPPASLIPKHPPSIPNGRSIEILEVPAAGFKAKLVLRERHELAKDLQMGVFNIGGLLAQ